MKKKIVASINEKSCVKMQEETPDTTQLKKMDNFPRSITQILKVVEFHRKKIIFLFNQLKKKKRECKRKRFGFESTKALKNERDPN